MGTHQSKVVLASISWCSLSCCGSSFVESCERQQAFFMQAWQSSLRLRACRQSSRAQPKQGGQNTMPSNCAFGNHCDCTLMRQVLACLGKSGGYGYSDQTQTSSSSFVTAEEITSLRKYLEKTMPESCIATAGEHTTTSPTQHFKGAGHTSCAKAQNSKYPLWDGTSMKNSLHSLRK